MFKEITIKQPMIKTSTPIFDLTAEQSQTEKAIALADFVEPSEKSIQAILNYSKNLEVRQSQLIPAIEIIKS